MRKEKVMKVGFAVQGNEGVESKVYDHFGSAPAFIIVDTEGKEVLTVNNQDSIMSTVHVIRLWLWMERVWRQWWLAG